MMLTFVSGKVPVRKRDELEAAYAYLKEVALPVGVVRSFLVRARNDPSVYMVVAEWKSREAFDRYISQVKSLRTQRIFRKLGIEPESVIYDLVDTLP